MHDEGTKRTASHVAMLLERLSRVSESMDTRHRQAAEQQERTVQSLPGILRQAADETLGNIAADAAQSLRTGLNKPLAEVAQQATSHHRDMRESTDAMIRVQHTLTGVVNRSIWLMAGVLAMLVLVTAVGGYLGWHYKQIIAQHQIQAELLQAYDQADVRWCAKQLCARVDRADKRYGDYFPIKPR